MFFKKNIYNGIVAIIDLVKNEYDEDHSLSWIVVIVSGIMILLFLLLLMASADVSV